MKMGFKQRAFDRQIPGTGEFHLRPLWIPEDIPVVHSWVTQPYAAYWGQVNQTAEEVAATYRAITAPDHVAAHLGFHDRKPAFLMECYWAPEDPIGQHFDVRPGDYGMHVLVAPAERRIPGFTWSVFTTVMDFLFSDPGVERVVVEPDVRNDKIHALNRRAGFEYQKLVELPKKTAHLAFCTRAQYAAALRKERR